MMVFGCYTVDIVDTVEPLMFAGLLLSRILWGEATRENKKAQN